VSGFEEEDEEICINTLKAVSCLIHHLYEIEDDMRRQKHEDLALDSTFSLIDPSTISGLTQPPIHTTKAAIEKSNSNATSPTSQLLHQGAISTMPFSTLGIDLPANPNTESPTYKPEYLVEKLIIPHLLRAVVTPELSEQLVDSTLDTVVKMWKNLCRMEMRIKVRSSHILERKARRRLTTVNLCRR
jgi:hypothetical protein